MITVTNFAVSNEHTVLKPWMIYFITMQKAFNFLSAIRSRYVMVQKMIPLTDKISMRLQNAFDMNNVLSMQTATHLAWRIRLTKSFLSFLLKFNREHGSTYTVKWMKAGLVAIQKELGQDRLVSLTTLGAALPYSRLSNGLPRIIPASDRGRIRTGDVKVIRFWTGLFNLYRVLKIPGELKISTITAPFTGSETILEDMITLVSRSKTHHFFTHLSNFKSIVGKSLVPSQFVLSRSASPSNKFSCTGILTDIYLLNTEAPALWQEILYYLHSVGTKVSSPFLKQLDHGYKLVMRLVGMNGKVYTGIKSGNKFSQTNLLTLKTTLRNGLGPGKGLSQFAIKEEAAGKIRLFALLDSITQSVLAPLHNALFDLLRLIPNDGTFDQDASIRRSQLKAVEAGKAFSFDLTAATDRLPARLTASIIERIFEKEGLGESWYNLMVDRVFDFNAIVAKKLNLNPDDGYRYSVGQPMGGLSSWAGLAITHHWIVQMAASRAYPNTSGWNTSYEILGDDLVMFDDLLAKEYLKIMADLGCEINLSKSIVSPNRPVFEFAKRTCWGPHIVSGISVAQVRAGWRVAGRVANVLSFANSGLITSPSLLAITLSRYAFSKGIAAHLLVRNNQRGMRLFAMGILSLLGTFYQSGKIPLKVLMTAIVDPRNEDADYSGEAVGLPLKASLDAAFSILKDATSGPNIQFSKQEVRDDVFDEYSSELSTVMLQSALKKAQLLLGNSEMLVQLFAQRMYTPFHYLEGGKVVPMEDLPSDVRLLFIQIENFTNWSLGLEFAKENPEDLYEELYQCAYKHAKYNHITFEEASKWLERIESLEFKLTLQEAAKPGKTILESAPILGAIRQMDPNKFIRPTYLNGPRFASIYSLEQIITPPQG
jgi:hypothetical protein